MCFVEEPAVPKGHEACIPIWGIVLGALITLALIGLVVTVKCWKRKNHTSPMAGVWAEDDPPAATYNYHSVHLTQNFYPSSRPQLMALTRAEHMETSREFFTGAQLNC